LELGRAFFLGPIWLAYPRTYLFASLLIAFHVLQQSGACLLSGPSTVALALIPGIIEAMLLGMSGTPFAESTSPGR
jgi:hypothetical protein